jgi:hypothetical protein
MLKKRVGRENTETPRDAIDELLGALIRAFDVSECPEE